MQNNLNNFLKALYKTNEIINVRIINKSIVNNIFVRVNEDTEKKLTELIKQDKNNHIYFTPIPRKEEKTKSYDRVNCFFVDIDRKDFKNDYFYTKHLRELDTILEKKNLMYTAKISSGNGLHLYWVLNKSETVDPQTFREIQLALIDLCKSDKSKKNVNDLLRLPYSYNVKDINKPKEVLIDDCFENNIYNRSDFDLILKEYKDKISKEVELVKISYNITDINNYDFKKIVLEVLLDCKINTDDYSDFLEWSIIFKNANFSYDEVDSFFRNSDNYNYEKNKKIYEGLKPNGSLTFGSAVYYAKTLGGSKLKEKLKDYYNKLKDIKLSESINNKVELDENIIIYTIEELFKYFSKMYKLVRFSNTKDYQDTFLVNTEKKKLLRLYGKNDNYNSSTKELIESEFLSKFLMEVEITKRNGEKEISTKEIKINFFMKELNKRIINEKINIIVCEKSNLSFVKNNEVVFSSDIDNGIIITNDDKNIEYNSNLKKEYHQNIDDEFAKLYGKNKYLIYSHIISSIINEDNENKHLFFVYGLNVNLGKSKTASLICNIVQNKKKSFGTTNLDKLWKEFYSVRCPILDNVDERKLINDELSNQLSSILTSESNILNIRYSVSGENFNSNVYPILTTKRDDLLDSASFTALKSRTIYFELSYNKYAENNIDRLLKDDTFIKKCKEHFYFLCDKYLQDLNKDNFIIENRNKGFFRVLYYLDNAFAKEYESSLKELRIYDEVTNEFLKIVKEKKLYNKEYLVSEWVDNFKKYCSNNKIDTEKISSYNLFSKYINKFLVSDKIDEFLVKRIRTNKSYKYSFEVEDSIISESYNNDNDDDDKDSLLKLVINKDKVGDDVKDDNTKLKKISKCESCKHNCKRSNKVYCPDFEEIVC